MRPDEVKRIVEAAYLARANEDYDTLARLFADDVEFRVAGDTSFPAAVTVRGTDAFLASVRVLIETFEFLSQDAGDWIIDGDRAAVRWRMQIQHLPSGRIVDTEVMDVWSLRAGRVASFVQFCDTAVFGALMAA